MGAFIVAIIIFIIAGVIALLQLFADGMRTVPSHESGAGVTLIVGAVLAVIVALTHFLPHIGW